MFIKEVTIDEAVFQIIGHIDVILNSDFGELNSNTETLDGNLNSVRAAFHKVNDNIIQSVNTEFSGKLL